MACWWKYALYGMVNMKPCRFDCSSRRSIKKILFCVNTSSAVTLGETRCLCPFFISQEAIAHELFPTEPAATGLSSPLYEQDEQPPRSPSLHLLHSWWSLPYPFLNRL